MSPQDRVGRPRRGTPSTTAERASSRPTERAFVVQFDPITGQRGRLRGRAEVVASGEGTHFQSLKQLVDFMVGVLRRPPDSGDAT